MQNHLKPINSPTPLFSAGALLAVAWPRGPLGGSVVDTLGVIEEPLIIDVGEGPTPAFCIALPNCVGDRRPCVDCSPWMPPCVSDSCSGERRVWGRPWNEIPDAFSEDASFSLLATVAKRRLSPLH